MLKLFINPELRDELPPLVGVELDNLRKTLKRDGVMDTIKYWFNPETNQNEIVDGHHRHQLALEMGLEYQAFELTFKSLTAAKMWQNVTQAGRRGYKALDRMVTLEKMLRAERGDASTVQEVVETVADAAGTSTRSVYRSMAKAKMGYENRSANGDEFDQSMPEEGFEEMPDELAQDLAPDDFNQGEPTDEEREQAKKNNPFTRNSKGKGKGMLAQQKSALRTYETLLGKIDGLGLHLMFDNSLILPQFKFIYESIEKERAKFPVPKKKFGR